MTPMPPKEERPDLYDDNDFTDRERPKMDHLKARFAEQMKVARLQQTLPAAEPVAAPTPSPVNESLALRRAGNIEAAIKLLYDAWSTNLADTGVATTLATMLAETEQFERAERVFQRALAASPDDDTLQINYATFLGHSGRHAEAAPALRRAAARYTRELQRHVKAQPTDPAAEHLRKLATCDCNLARVHLARGDTGFARDLAEKWLVFDGVCHSACDVIGLCINAEDGDWIAECGQHHAEQRAAPAMVAELIEAAAGNDNAAALEVLRICDEALQYLHFDWLAAVPDCAKVVAAAMKIAGELPYCEVGPMGFRVSDALERSASGASSAETR